MNTGSRRILTALLALVLALGLLPSSPKAAAAEPVYNLEIQQYDTYYTIYIELGVLNRYREANGLEPLTLDIDLTRAAMQRAAEIAVCYDGSHTRPNGEPWHTVPGMHGKSTAENIAYGFGAAEEVMKAWEASPGHNANILNPNFKSVGLGKFKGDFWVQEFSSDEADELVKDWHETAIHAEPETYTVDVLASNLNLAYSMTNDAMLPGSESRIRLFAANPGVQGSTVQVLMTSVESLTPDTVKAELTNTADENYAVVTGVSEGPAQVRIGFGSGSGASYITAEFEIGGGMTKDMFDIDLSPEVYNGNYKYKTITSSLSGYDYDVSYRNNRDAGTATIVIEGWGSYAGTTLEFNFEILKAERTFSPSISNKLYTEGGRHATVWLGCEESSSSTFRYTSSNPNVVTVDDRGELTAIAPGYSTITIEAGESKNYKAGSATVEVMVTQWSFEDKPAVETPPPSSTSDPSGVKTSFVDVPAGMWCEKQVAWAVENGVTNGIDTAGTKFGPNDTCTQGHILTFLYRAAKEPAVTISNPYSNGSVRSGEFYYDAMLWAYQEGIVTDRALDPNAPCTRSDVVTYLWRLSDSPSSGTRSFADVPAGAAYAGAVSWAVESGITNGVDTAGTKFGPTQTCTRGQIVTFLYRYFVESLNG